MREGDRPMNSSEVGEFVDGTRCAVAEQRKQDSSPGWIVESGDQPLDLVGTG